MQHIQTVTLGSAAASIIFSGIPQTFTDLKLLLSAREATTENIAIQFRINDNNSNLSERFLRGNGSAVLSSSTSSQFITYVARATGTSNTFGNTELYIANYASSTSPKSLSLDGVEENNATSAFMLINAGLWNSTAPITELSITTFTGNLAQNTSASLYGITAGSDGIVAVS